MVRSVAGKEEGEKGKEGRERRKRKLLLCGLVWKGEQLRKKGEERMCVYCFFLGCARVGVGVRKKGKKKTSCFVLQERKGEGRRGRKFEV